MWNLKNKPVTITKKKQTHRYREQISGCQRREREEGRHYRGRG